MFKLNNCAQIKKNLKKVFDDSDTQFGLAYFLAGMAYLVIYYGTLGFMLIIGGNVEAVDHIYAANARLIAFSFADWWFIPPCVLVLFGFYLCMKGLTNTRKAIKGADA